MQAVTPSLIHHSLAFMHLLACPYHCNHVLWSKNTVLSLPKHLYCHAFESRVTRGHTISLNSTRSQGPRYFIQIQPRNVAAAYMACFESFSLISPSYCMWALFFFFLVSTTFSLTFVLLSCPPSAGAISIFSFFSLLLLLHFNYNLGLARCAYCVFNPLSLYLYVLGILDCTCYYFFKYLTVA